MAGKSEAQVRFALALEAPAAACDPAWAGAIGSRCGQAGDDQPGGVRDVIHLHLGAGQRARAQDAIDVGTFGPDLGAQRLEEGRLVGDDGDRERTLERDVARAVPGGACGSGERWCALITRKRTRGAGRPAHGSAGLAHGHLFEPARLAKLHARPRIVSVVRFLIHQRVHDSAARCFERIAQHYSEAQRRETGIELFGGCLNVRRKRGGTTWSMHSWGIAIDFDPARNPLRSNRHNARLAQPDCVTFWEIWEEEGWVSLGRMRDFDWMHVEAVG